MLLRNQRLSLYFWGHATVCALLSFSVSRCQSRQRTTNRTHLATHTAEEERKMTTEREANIYEAKLAEQAERYDEMVAAIKKVAASLKTGEGLSVEERNIFSVAYKNVIGSRRATWRIVSSILKKEEDRPEKIEMRIKHARALANKVEGEMNSICNDCLKVIDDHLLPSAASDAESKTFYYKMYVLSSFTYPPPSSLYQD